MVEIGETQGAAAESWRGTSGSRGPTSNPTSPAGTVRWSPGGLADTGRHDGWSSGSAAWIVSGAVPEPTTSPPRAGPDVTALDQATAALRAGGAVVLPTDTVYGVAALPSVAGATAQLFALKDRSDGQPLAVLVADVNQAAGGSRRRWPDRWRRG